MLARALASVLILVAASSSAPADTTTAAAAWRWPVAPVEIVKPFEAPATPYAAGHRGVDVAASPGDVVRAPTGGVVWFSGVVVDRPVVTIDAGGGVLVSMEPVAADLPVGATVAAGDVLGEVARGGHCDESCLHLGVRVDGEYVSPLLFLGGVPPAVLLPLD